MNKEERIKKISFNSIDCSKYKQEIEEIERIYRKLKSNKRFMRKLSKFVRKDEEQRWIKKKD